MSDTSNIGKDQVDYNDLMFAMERGVKPLRCIPAPVTVFETGEHKGKPKINPHVTRFLISERYEMRRDGKHLVQEWVDIFHIKPIYYRHLNGGWRPMSEVTTHHGNHRIELKEDWDDHMELAFLAWLIKRAALINGSVLIPSPFQRKAVPLALTKREGHAVINFATLTAYPDPNPETATVDGWVLGQASGSSWLDSRNHAGGGTNAGVDDSGASSPERFLWEDRGNSGADYNTRSFFLFDTSSLTSAATISAATLSFYITNKAVGADMGNGYVVPSFPASNTSLAFGDYDGFTINSSPKFGDITSASVTNNQYHDVTINSTGRADISKTGVTKWGTRSAKDVDCNGSTPDYTGVECGQAGYFADQTGTTNDPKLVVTYSTSTPVTVAVTTQSVTLSAIARTIKTGTTKLVNTQSLTLSAVARTVSLPKLVSVNTQELTLTVPSYIIQAGNTTVAVNTLVITLSAQAPTILKSWVQAVNALSLTLSTIAATIVQGSGVTVTPSTQTLTATIPAYTVLALRNIIVAVNTLTLTLTAAVLARVGSVWRKSSRNSSGDWTPQSRNSSGDWTRQSRNST